MKVLVVVDMQNDFVDGALGTWEAQQIVESVKEKVVKFDGKVFFTRDTHQANYLDTQEGKKLPVEHCIENTNGWEIIDALKDLVKEEPVNKPTFGSIELAKKLEVLNAEEPIESIELIGVCTDICVISNAMLIKATLPEVPISVDSKCCAGVTEESHQRALDAMQMCQISIL